ncbi:beta-glucosidase-related glycosidase [Tirmania nivea]|nr:beta-glucosidase-related glycosidase [Tirmania nivea]
MKLSATLVYLALLLATAGEVSSGAPDPAYVPGLQAEYEYEKRQSQDEVRNTEKRQSYSTFSPPYYPAPKGGWLADWSASYTKAAVMVGQMTLAEKVNVTMAIGWSMGKCVGNTGPVYRLGFPSLGAQDGPLGVRYADLRALAMGQEAKGKGVHVLLGPSVGPLGRVPHGGRNWEGFGSDPYLQGWGGRQTVLGIQNAGVQATVKHYIANEQEHFRGDAFMSSTISSNVDDRTMHEASLWPFSEAVRAGIASVMCSYNMINSSYGCQNSLLNGLLKNKLGFQGYVMADWLAQRSGVGSALAGMDLTQPGGGVSWANGQSLWGPELSRAVLNGSIPIDRLDDMATQIVAAWYQLDQDKGFPDTSFFAWTKVDTDLMYRRTNTGPTANHKAVATSVAREGIVVVKNEGNVLPLSTSDVIRVFGSDAGPNSSVSDTVNTQTTTLAFTANAKCLSDSGEGYITVEGHSGDRNNLLAWHNGDALVKAVAGACANTIVIVHTVGPIFIEAWADLPNVKAMLLVHLPGLRSPSGKIVVYDGEEGDRLGDFNYNVWRGFCYSTAFHGGLYIDYKLALLPPSPLTSTDTDVLGISTSTKTTSLPDILRVQSHLHHLLILLHVHYPRYRPPLPTSKLPVPTYPTTIPPASQVTWPAAITTRIQKSITMGNYPYPLGYSTVDKPLARVGGGRGGNPALWDVMFRVSVTVKNTGAKRAKEVVQLYAEFPAIEGFEKVELAAGEEDVVVLEVTRKTLSVWDVVRQQWIIPQSASGGYIIHIGNSSRNLPLSCKTNSSTCGAGAITTSAPDARSV